MELFLCNRKQKNFNCRIPTAAILQIIMEHLPLIPNLENHPTPYYMYDMGLLEKTLKQAAEASGRYGYHMHYAMKANHQKEILTAVKQHGLGVDCVSGYEVQAALDLGFDPSEIVFAGVGKTDAEIRLALQNDIFCFNCESVEELQVISAIAEMEKMTARVALRVNPGVDAGTHHHITTGLTENKFGIQLPHLQKALQICAENIHLHFMGLHFHIGSQITSNEPFINLVHRVNWIWDHYNINDYGPCMLNLGGGLGVDYENPLLNPMPDFAAFFAMISSNLNIPDHISIHFEPGRSLVAQCGSLITRVLYVKEGLHKQFIIADAGMTEIMRPALYGARHRIDNLSRSTGQVKTYDVVGPACESSDVFASDLRLSSTHRGDLLAIRSCGAYVQSMTLNYNLRPAAEPVFYYPSFNRLKSLFEGIPEPFMQKAV